MARSSKAVPWFIFAAGGTVMAFVLPVLILITGLAPAVGVFTDAMSYATMHNFVSFWIVKLALFGILFLAVWHAAHRLRVCLHDFGIRADEMVAIMLYGLATFGTVAAAVALLAI